LLPLLHPISRAPAALRKNSVLAHVVITFFSSLGGKKPTDVNDYDDDDDDNDNDNNGDDDNDNNNNNDNNKR